MKVPDVTSRYVKPLSRLYRRMRRGEYLEVSGPARVWYDGQGRVVVQAVASVKIRFRSRKVARKVTRQ